MRYVRRVLLAVGAIGCACGVLAGPASAESLVPWWNLTVGARPTVLNNDRGRAEIVTLTVSATKGDFYVENRATKANDRASGGVRFDASAAEVQSALETVFPESRLSVSGGRVGSEEVWSYAISFPGQVFAEDEIENPSSHQREDAPVAVGTGTALTCTELRLCPLEGAKDELSALESQRGEIGGQIVVTADNLGDGQASGASDPIVVSDALPESGKLRATSIKALWRDSGETRAEPGPVCSLASMSCSYSGQLPPYEEIEVQIDVESSEAQSGEVDRASVSGGSGVGAATGLEPTPRSAQRSLQVGGTAKFGLEQYTLVPEKAGGGVDTQAGSHPFQVTSVVNLNQQAPNGRGEPRSVGLARRIAGVLPPGFVGNPTPLVQCTDTQFSKDECPEESAIGVATITYNAGGLFQTQPQPIYNMVPNAGEPARFAFDVYGQTQYLDASVGTGGDYAITVTGGEITQQVWLQSVKLTFWGVPGDPRHNGQRSPQCLREEPGCVAPPANATPPPFLIMPTSCEEPFQSTAYGESWGTPERPAERFETTYKPSEYGLLEAVDGCDRLPFSAEIGVTPEVPDASTATGLEVSLNVPQAAELNPEGLAEGTVRDTTVALPAGVTLNSGGAGGLQACGEPEIGLDTGPGGAPNHGVSGELLFTPILNNPFCPGASKIGNVEIKTPLLPEPLLGSVYLAIPAPFGEAGHNPFGSLIAMYIVAEDHKSGTLVKLPGEAVPCEHAGQIVAGKTCEATGQLISTFENTPQLPFEYLKLRFFGESRAPLATPALCGSYTTHATLIPWAFEEGSTPATAESSFSITSGPNGAPCADPRPFEPELQAGMVDIQAGAFSELRTTMGHPDADQVLGGLSVTMPPGLSGLLSGVKLCEEPQAREGTCGPESLIGHTTVTAGLGSTPAVVARPGSVYITGPYNGHSACTVGEAECAPFGLTIVNPAETGPFNLGNVIVRAKIEVNPITAQLTVTSDQLPTSIKGIPLNLQHVLVSIDRPGFTFNPTNCEPMKITGTMTSGENSSTTAPVSTPFQVTNCANLKFEPHVEAFVSGKVTKQNGTSFTVKITKPAVQGQQADLKKFKIELPVQLPSRLTTLQKACTAAQFEANPAGCPPESVIGRMRALTPVLPVPIEGPMYFVSHGGEAFPSLEIVLQGYGVKVILIGTTFISKAGITSSTFATLPDVPFTLAEASLHNGPYSALTGIGNLCAPTKVVTVRKKVAVKTHGKPVRNKHGKIVYETKKITKTEPTSLTMPTELVAQGGGDPIKVNTPVSVTECPKAAVKKTKKTKGKRGDTKGQQKKSKKHA